MVAVPLLSAAFFRVALGLLGDRYGPKRVGLLSMGVVVVALLGGWLGANSYGALLGVGVLLGVAGASFAIALPLASRHYPPRHQGLAMGIAGAGNSGTVLTTLAAPRLAEHVGWHAVFGLALIPVADRLARVRAAGQGAAGARAAGPRQRPARDRSRSATPGACAASTRSPSAPSSASPASCRSSSATSTGSRRSTPPRSSRSAPRSAPSCARSAATSPTASAGRRC